MSSVASQYQVRNSEETAGDKPEEGGDDVKSSCPLWPGLHTYYNGCYSVLRHREVKRITERQSQFGLKSATRLHEAGIASNRGSACRGEYVLGPCTHRPSYHESRQCPKPVAQPAKEGAVEGRAGDWGQVVTRYPYENVGMDHLLSKEKEITFKKCENVSDWF